VLGCIHRWLQPRPHLIADQFSLRDFAHPKLPSSFAQRVQIIREHCLGRQSTSNPVHEGRRKAEIRDPSQAQDDGLFFGRPIVTDFRTDNPRRTR
ncbi:MAG: hypothetical protein P4L99_28700, partial [Chthoniobacter sp.]|nr:hypothetical protein [Chthoniobacter sp.]